MFGVAPEPVREEPQPVPTAPIVLAGDTLWDQYTNGLGALGSQMMTVVAPDIDAFICQIEQGRYEY